MLNVFKPTPQILKNITIKDKNILDSSKCRKAIKRASELIQSKGRILVRKSGTEPKIRIMVESNYKNLNIKCIQLIKKSIK